jgi:hypothetical protein
MAGYPGLCFEEGFSRFHLSYLVHGRYKPEDDSRDEVFSLVACRSGAVRDSTAPSRRRSQEEHLDKQWFKYSHRFEGPSDFTLLDQH